MCFIKIQSGKLSVHHSTGVINYRELHLSSSVITTSVRLFQSSHRTDHHFTGEQTLRCEVHHREFLRASDNRTWRGHAQKHRNSAVSTSYVSTPHSQRVAEITTIHGLLRIWCLSTHHTWSPESTIGIFRTPPPASESAEYNCPLGRLSVTCTQPGILPKIVSWSGSKRLCIFPISMTSHDSFSGTRNAGRNPTLILILRGPR
jgi:hypothetical protein